MKKNGAAARIAAYVAGHTGCTRAELLAGLGVKSRHWAMPTYCVKIGLIHSAGPRGSQRHYIDAQQARDEHARIAAEVKERRAAKRAVCRRLDTLRRRAKRHEAGGKKRDTRPGLHKVQLAPGVRLAPDVRITIAPPLRDRWAA